MLWLIQGNLDKNDGLKKMTEILSEKEIPFKLVKSIPFSNIVVDIDVDINQYEENNIPKIQINDTNCVVFGSYSLALFAKENNLIPGGFVNENYEYSKWAEGWGNDLLLNGDFIQAKVKDINNKIPHNWKKIFSRPTEDTKSFAGQVLDVENFKYWINNVSKNTDRFLDSETEIIISNFKEIQAEYRLFVVKDKIVTGSMYKLKQNVITSDIIPDEVIEFAYQAINKWSPDIAYVLDIAVTNEGLKIIEINNINSSGFYKSDIEKIVTAINNL
jgi:hypothetical protein